MLEGTKAEEIVEEIVRDWEMDSIDTNGQLGGIMTTWIPVLQRIEIIKHDPTLETKLIDGETET